MDGSRGTQLIGSGAPSGSAGPDIAVPGVQVRDLIDAVHSLRPGLANGAAADGGSELAGRTEPADGAELINLLRGLEDLKSAASAAQARIAVAFDAARR
ncbi:hypothetical protein AB0O52_07650, partial [Arthrobacter sp. NPDC080073]